MRRLIAPSKCPVEKVPVKKIPVTQEHMALKVATGELLTPAEKCYPDALAESIISMAFFLSHGYSASCRDDTEDLVGDCMLRLVKRLETYDPNRGAKFNTWAWHVFKSVLNFKYFKHKKYKDVFVQEDERGKARACAKEDRTVLANEMSQAVRELIGAHPREKRFIQAIFGNMEGTIHVFPSKVCLSKAIRESRINSRKGHIFYKKIIKPFFMERFEWSQEGGTNEREDHGSERCDRATQTSPVLGNVRRDLQRMHRSVPDQEVVQAIHQE
jgi:hypothetical protein